jgi:hypothetical protein
VQVELGQKWLAVQIGRFAHVVEWLDGRLELHHAHVDKDAFLNRTLVAFSSRTALAQATKAGLRDLALYDSHRFIMVAQVGVIAVVDIYGQVAILDRRGDLVCMFFVYRGQIGAWMPDGTCYGPRGLLGVPETPGALEKIGVALRTASERGGQA